MEKLSRTILMFGLSKVVFKLNLRAHYSTKTPTSSQRQQCAFSLEEKLVWTAVNRNLRDK